MIKVSIISKVRRCYMNLLTSLDKELLMLGGKVPPRGKSYKEDELGERNGRALSGRLLQVFNEIIGQARNLVETSSYKNASQKEFVDFLDKMRGAITMAYPIGLPEWDPVQALVDPKSQVELWDLVQGCLNPQETELWWAGKKLDKNTLLSERIGKNDKCKLKCRLAKSGSGPPLREPLISEKERKQMMALYYKKQGEHKKLSEDTDDQYLFQQWADPNSLKQRLNGTGNIRLF